MSIDLQRYLPQYFEESADCLAQLGGSLESLSTSWSAALADKASRAAHCIKGNSGAFGFDEIGAVAAELDYSLRHSGEGFGEDTPSFIAQCRAACGLLAEWLRDREQGRVPDAAEVSQVVEQLRHWQLRRAGSPAASAATRSRE